MRHSPPPSSADASGPSLANLEQALQTTGHLSAVRRRDLRSAVARVAALLGEVPARVTLDLESIAIRLSAVNPLAAGLSAKRLANIRSDFLAAVRQSGLHPVMPPAKSELSFHWQTMMARLPAKRHRLGLARLARYASAARTDPAEFDDATMEQFIGEVRRGSLHQNPNVLHRNVATIWNEVAATFPDLGLAPVSKPCFRAPAKRIVWDTTVEAFRADVAKYLEWSAGVDQFAEDARPRPLAPRTLKLRHNQIHAAITALVESDVPADSLSCLGDLVRLDHFRRILRQRYEEAGRKPNNFNRDLAEALIQIAREWVKADPADLAELKRLSGKMPMLPKGLTPKNKRSVAQFDDPEAVRRLLDLPAQLWIEVRRDPKPNFRTLARAQAALAIAMLTYMPVRSHNLHELMFGKHLFLHDGARATSSLEIPADEVKNKTTGLSFDIPPKLAKMLIEYRDRIAPKVIGRRPERVFINADGSPKSHAMVALLIKTYLSKRAGIVMTPHQFRHLGAKIILEDQPGAHELVRQFLGHQNLKTTTDFYAGLNTRRAGLHHQRLIEAAITPRPAEQKTLKKRPSHSILSTNGVG